MTAHLLGDPARYTNGTLTIFAAKCACGLDVYEVTLPKLWAAHDVHLAVVRAMSKANHPSNHRLPHPTPSPETGV